MSPKRKRLIHKILQRFLDVIIICILFFFGINIAIVRWTQGSIIKSQDIDGQYDVVLVPGASVEWLRLSPVLQDRIETAIQMYNNKKTLKVMISWDTWKKNYDEVKAMQVYLRNRGIPPSDILVDTQWSTTFDSVFHLTLFTFKRIAITTQAFHLPRAIFIAQSLWLSVDWIVSDRSTYKDEGKYERRESFSRIKAFLDVLWYYIS